MDNGIKNVEINDLINEITSFTSNELKNNDICRKIVNVSFKRIANDKIINILHDYLKYKIHFSFNEYVNKQYESEKTTIMSNREYLIGMLNDIMRIVIIEWVFDGYEKFLIEIEPPKAK